MNEQEIGDDYMPERVQSSSESHTSSEEFHSIEEHTEDFVVFNYNDPSSHSGIIKAIIRNDLEKVKQLVAEGNSLRVVDNHGNTPLHVAVTIVDDDGVEIVQYLLDQEEVDKNARNHYGQTPLLLSTTQAKEATPILLIEKGADVQIPTNEEVTCLHCAVRYSTRLSESLILAGADINCVDYNGDTPLHDSCIYGTLEVICMLLYYGANVNIKNTAGLTPFMQSLAMNKMDIAEEMFEYVTDFNLATMENMSTLFLAITSGFPRIIDMIQRGADVNYNENEHFTIFNLGVPLSLDVFKYVWNIFDYVHVWRQHLPNILIHILNDVNTTASYKLEVLKTILQSDDIQKQIILTADSEVYAVIHPLANKLYKMNIGHALVHEFCAILLSFNLKVYDTDLDMVYERYGYCELFKLLLHMDIRSAGVLPFNCFPRMIYTMNECCYSLLNNIVSAASVRSLDSENLFDHIIYPPTREFLIESMNNHPSNQKFVEYLKVFPQVPKLQELSRLAARKYFCHRYQIKNSLQFFTVLKHSDISQRLKQHIAFEIPLYRQYLTPELLEFRKQMKEFRDDDVMLLDNVFYNSNPFSSEYPIRALS